MAILIVTKTITEAGEQIRTTQFSGSTLRIGRGTSNDLHLEDNSVLLNHAVIQEAGSDYLLRDLGGVSMTTLNGQAVKEAVLPQRGVIRIGPYRLEFSRETSGLELRVEYGLVEETVTQAGLSESGQVQALQAVPSGEQRRQEAEGPAAASRQAKPRVEKINLVDVYQLNSTYVNKTSLTIVIVLVVLGGTVLTYGLGKHRMFIPGTISMKHRLFANECARCHEPWKPIMTVVADKFCLACHSGPPHFSQRAYNPAPQCASCHAEHKSRAFLAALYDYSCIECHGDLKVKESRIPISKRIHSFSTDHPEFAVSIAQPGAREPLRVRLTEKERAVDTAAMKLNHKRHLASDLMGPEGPEQLTCASCHRPDLGGKYMQPISYKRDCLRCHLLDFDERFSGKTVPHGKQLDGVMGFLQATYSEYYLLTHKQEIKTRGPARRLPGEPKSKEELWVDEMVEKAMQFVVGKPHQKTVKGKCQLCHILEFPEKAELSTGANLPQISGGEREAGSSYPKIRKPAMPVRWLPHSIFGHSAHNALKCIACHEAAPKSESTTDVLLPGVASCRSCHFEPGGARAQCLECHVYHDKTEMRKPATPPSSIERFKPRSTSSILPPGKPPPS